jgi:hypothetical protein
VLDKTKVALCAAIVVGVASAAYASPDSKHRPQPTTERHAPQSAYESHAFEPLQGVDIDRERDDPPGSAFQTQGLRVDEGDPPR